MLKKLLAIALVSLLSTPVLAHSTQPDDEITVYKFEAKEKQGTKLVRKYRKKWKDVVIDKDKLDMINSLSRRYELQKGTRFYISDIGLLGDSLWTVNMVEEDSPVIHQIYVLMKQICIVDPIARTQGPCFK